MHKWTWRLALLPILLLAAGLRLFGNDWDRYEHYHPDERYISWVASTLSLPDTWQSAFVPNESTFNPYYWPAESEPDCIVAIKDEPRDFAYGHLPLYLGAIATAVVEHVYPAFTDDLIATCRGSGGELGPSRMDKIAAVSRALTALIDVGSVALIFLIGRRLFGDVEALFAALLLALTVTHIQLAHFFATDPYMTFFVLAALFFMIQAQQASRPGLYLILAGAMTGFAVGSKFSAVMLFGALLLSWFWARGLVLAQTRQGGRLFFSLIGTMLVPFFAFAMTNPFAVVDLSCAITTQPIRFGPLTVPSFNLRSCFLFNITKQAGMVNGAANFPFTRQYAGTLPYLYFLEMQLRWGMGFLAGGIGIVGSLWIVLRALRFVRLRNLRNSAEPVIRASMRPVWILLAFCIPYFLSTGNFFVKFMRYWQPLVPFMILFGVGWVWSWRNRWLRQSAIVTVSLFTALYAFSFVNIYREPHPWAAASVWIYDNVPPDSMILYERWGDRLPSTLYVDGTRLAASQYRYAQDDLTWLSGIGNRDDEQKWVDNLSLMAESDYIVIDSNRIYGVVPRLKTLYPISNRVYQPLFDGSLGFEAVYANSRTPQLGRFHIKPDFFNWPGLTPPDLVQSHLDSMPGITLGRVDESFTLYDQSLVMVFENVGGFSAEKLNEIVAGTVSVPTGE